MRIHVKLLLLQIMLVFLPALNSRISAQSMHKFPPTPEKPVVDLLHGIKLSDPYQWLEDKLDPEVQSWTRKQHDATVFALRSTPEYPGLHEEIETYLDRDILGPLFLKADRQFFYKKQKGDQQYKLYTSLDGKDIVIFDPHPLDGDGKASISGIDFTEDAGIVAVGVQLKGDEISNHYLIDTKTGKQLGDPVMGLRGFGFTKDGKKAYVAKASRESLEKQEPIKTYLHKIGSDPSKDVFLNAPRDAKDFVSFTDSRYSDLTFMFEGDFYSNTVSVKSISSKEEFKTIYSSKKSRAYPSAIDNKIYFYTNDNAPNFKIMVADKANPEFANWKTLIPEKETVIEDFE
ncbi:MAG: prolyl oligopeptidase, partial [Limisphaerales bacterium]